MVHRPGPYIGLIHSPGPQGWSKDWVQGNGPWSMDQGKTGMVHGPGSHRWSIDWVHGNGSYTSRFIGMVHGSTKDGPWPRSIGMSPWTWSIKWSRHQPGI